MGETTFRSAGVMTREIDLSQPQSRGPTGVPAGIVGAAEKGPAFVPLTFGSALDFAEVFGDALENDEQAYAYIAVSQWLANAGACTFLRVLGVGDGKKRDDATGNVRNAGFVVGGQTIQNGGQVSDNIYANSGVGAVEGRTYFLGCFMSESAGSTIFSEAGMQGPQIFKDASAAIQVGQHVTGTIILQGDDGTKKAFHFGSGSDGDARAAYTCKGPVIEVPAGVLIKTDAARSAAQIRQAFAEQAALQLNMNTRHTAPTLGGVGRHFTILSQSAKAGHLGNTPITYIVPSSSAGVPFAGDVILGPRLSTFKDGAGAAIPSVLGGDTQFRSGSVKGAPAAILRGVLLAPSGVIIHLGSKDEVAPSATETARVSDDTVMGRKGAITGSVDSKSGGALIKLVLNGHKGTTEYPNLITASLDPTEGEYISKVLNTEPADIEKAGHLLYAHYDVHPNLAAITGSGAIYSSGGTEHNAAFILTSSVARVGRGGGALSSAVPVYESFEDRFTTPKTPFITSQDFGAAPYNLFRLHSLDDGAYSTGKEQGYKVSVTNLNNTEKYPRFDIQIRRLGDTDRNPVVLKTFPGLTLDPGSDRYIARVIGDQQVKYDFDSNKESQKLIIEGTHPVRNKFVRVEMSEDMKKKEVPVEAIPFGFRGPDHLVTSGSMLTSITGSENVIRDFARGVQTPPIPYRRKITLGTGIATQTLSSLFWGFQSTRLEQMDNPNAPLSTDEEDTTTNDPIFDDGLLGFLKYFPTHRKDAINFSVGNNHGTADSNGSILDCDRFQNARFSLHKVQVVTASAAEGRRADPQLWLSASYVRQGGITPNDDNKTRALTVDDLHNAANRKYCNFTVPMQGGFNGLDIFDKEKQRLSNTAAKREMDDLIKQGGLDGSTVAAYRKAIDIMGDTSGVDIKLLALPGMRHSSITDYAIDEIETRFDALYIMDIEERDEFNTVITSSVQSPHVVNTVTAFKNRGLDSSFAAAYFPDVTVIHPKTGDNTPVPPSCVILGAYSLNDKVGHPWFAPAGFARGSVFQTANGALEPVVSNVITNRENLDVLYEADINPIVQYVGRPLSVWGQKTLLANASALDRVNVRRLLIDVRRKVKAVATQLLFEPNRAETLAKFSALVNPILQNIQDLQGVDRFKVIIDSSTTTQADIENNTLRGKIFLQPTRTVEFVALDFEVTNTI